jgi:ribonuclease HI
VAYADGSCIGNPGPGGWGILVQYPDGRTVELAGGEEDTTNNRMELRAVIEALRATPDAPAVRIISDSQYVVKGATMWLARWRRTDWRTSAGQPVPNRDLWEELEAIADGRSVDWEWRRAHTGDPGNEYAHRLEWSAAVSAAQLGQRGA